ncbi:MAG: MFS transporter [Chloroflexi bacterium]|nr:MFS transporter [Chloroflexota bacterium]
MDRHLLDRLRSVSRSEPDGRRGAFYGWYVVGALFFATFLGVGTRQGFGVFVESWERDFGVSVGTISAAAAVGWVGNGLSQPLFGRLTDAFGGRRVLVASTVAMGLGTVAMAGAQNVFALLVLYGFVVSAAGGGVFPTPAAAVVSRWFQRRRGTAMSFVTFGGSAGGIVLVPFAAYLLLATDWRVAWLAMGGLVLALGVPLLLAIVRSDPGELGLQADGDDHHDERVGAGPRPAVHAQTGPLVAREWPDSFRTSPIWQLSLAYGVCGVTTAMASVHYVRWAATEGISPGTAALAFGLLSAINGAGLLTVGAISDRMQRKNLLGGVYLVRAVAFVMLVALPGVPALWTFAVIGGMSWLATVPLTTSLTADVYGLRHIGTLNGLVTMAHQLGGAAAVLVAGFAFDRFGTYDVSFLAAAALLVVAGLLSLTIRERAYSTRFQPVTAEAAATGRSYPTAAS